ncbi:MAG: hypothetical protein M1834_009208 [Cirrosporium novae-zelandiae]|nr:MAG: hypothetical protein M1834_009208 [Cirrosporium novae-zelandiae]
MASNAIYDHEKNEKLQGTVEASADSTSSPGEDVGVGEIETSGSDHLHRKLRGREVQLFALGAAIGTSLFVQMGSVLPKSGPAGLFIGFVWYGTVMLAVNECFAEMVCYLPIPSPFVQLGGKWVDEALSFAMGWNYFLNMALLVPYEIVALNLLLNYWTDKVPVEVVIIVVIVLYSLLNLISVRYFGIAEFYFSIFKVLLILGCIFFTFITMVGGNPLHDVYGFRYWNKPGAFVEHLAPGNTGRFLAIVSSMVQASFTICGPEYISMVASETKRPRKILPRAFRSFMWRMLFFFIIGSLCIGIVIPYNDPTLAKVLDGTKSSTAAASPYVIAMDRLKISGLPHVVNALIMTSVFSSGNGLLFSAARALYGMSIQKKAPAFFSRCTKAGVPYFSVIGALLFCLLAFLQVSNSSASVLTWLVYLITACQLLNYQMAVGITYLHFHRAMKVQGVDRSSLPYIGKLQPYAAYYATGGVVVMMLVLGYDLFITGGWSLLYFFLDYTMLAAFPLAFIGWKLVKRTKYVRPEVADLTLGTTKKEIDVYEELYVPPLRSKPASWFNRLFE